MIDGPSPGELLEAIGAADAVVLHLWNSPELTELLEADLPPCRLLVWPHVVGNTPPQFLPGSIFERAAIAVGTSQRSAAQIESVTQGPRPEVIPPMGGWERVAGVSRSTRDGYNVGYIGSLGSDRIHPDFVAISAAVRVPGSRFIVCGDGDAAAAIDRQARAHGERFEFLGQVGRIGAALADFDVFGYPLLSGTSASSDLTLKEAMFAGVPPVVLPGTGAEEIVEDGRTGAVAADPDAYSAAIEALYEDPAERGRLAGNARQHATEHWSPEALGPRWGAVLERLLEMPRSAGPALAPPEPARPPGTGRFIRGLGDRGADFEASLAGSAQEAADAERRIRGAPAAVLYQHGGLLDYRRRYPEEPMLALWTALLLSAQGRAMLATAELARARQLGLDPARIATHQRAGAIA